MIFLLTPLVIYILLLIYFCIGNILYKDSNKIISKKIGISVIIAIRNGESSIKNLINNLLNQKYDGNIEFLLVDDESTDSTKQIIKDIQSKDNRFKYLSSTYGNNNLKYKKKALDLGIQESKYNYLLFTDVDCRIPPYWVDTMSNYFKNGYEFIVGHSFTRESHSYNLVSIFQKFDFFLLMIMCRGSSYFSSPWASSGQNQGYTKLLYNKVGGFIKIDQFYGDDTAFLQLCIKKGMKCCFVDKNEARILSRSEHKLKHFMSQRARWAFDANQMWRINIMFYITLLSTFIFYISTPLIVFFLLDNHANKILFLLLAKLIFELLLVFIGSIGYGKSFRIKHFIVWQLFHIPYIIGVGILSFFRIRWRGRKLV